MKRKLGILILILAAVCLFAFAACSNGSDGENRIPPVQPPDVEYSGGTGAKSLTTDEKGMFAYGTGIESVEYASAIPERFSNLSYYSFPKSGVKITASNAGTEIWYTEIVDLNKVAGNVVTFEILTGIDGADYSMSSVSVELVDIYDENNSVEVNWFNYSNPVVSNILVNCNGISRGCMYEGADNQFGLSRVEYGAISYISNFSEEFSWITIGGEPNHDPFNFKYDLKENRVLTRLGIPDMEERIVLDVDDPAHMGNDTSCFQGFTTGEVYVKFTFNAIGKKGGIIVTSVGGKDLSSPDLKPAVNDVIRLDTRPEYRTGFPAGQKGKAYAVPRAFGEDILMGKLNIGTMVRSPSGKTQMLWEEDTCIPDETGTYEVIYTCKDMAGNNVIKRMNFEVLETVGDMTFKLNGADNTISAGKWDLLPTVSVEGGSGEKELSLAYEFNNEAIQPDANGGFVFPASGTLKVKASAADFLGTSAEKEFTVDIEEGYSFETLSPMPEILFAGQEIVFPDFSAKNLGTAATELSDKTITVNGAALGTDRKFTVPESGPLTVVYSAGKNSEVSQQFTVRVLDYDNENINLAAFFAVDNVVASHTSSGVQMNVPSGTGAMTFGNVLSAMYLEMHFLLPDTPTYSFAEIVLTDAVYPDTQVAFRLGTDKTVSDNFLLMDAQGGYDFYKYPLSYKLAAGELYHFFYDNETQTVYNANQTMVAVLRYTTGNKVFTGFPSGTVRVSVRLLDVTENGEFTVAQLGNQPFAKEKLVMGDLSAPQLATASPVVSGNVSLGSAYTVPKGMALDVLQYTTAIDVTFSDPDGNKLLDKADAGEDRSFVLDKAGYYRLSYYMWDGINSIEKTYLIKAVDSVAPVLTVDGTYETDYAVGTKVTLLKATASDNMSAAADIEISVIVKRPDYADIICAPGDEFTFDHAGHYKLTYCAVDAAGNYVFTHFDINVY